MYQGIRPFQKWRGLTRFDSLTFPKMGLPGLLEPLETAVNFLKFINFDKFRVFMKY